MSKKEKKVLNSDSPEWQLFQNMKSAKLSILSHIKDAERSTAMSENSRKKYEQYHEALVKLIPDFNEDDY
jgi:hypothetical protein